MAIKLNKVDEKLEITYKIKGLNLGQYLLYAVIILLPIHNTIKYILPEGGSIIIIILKILGTIAFTLFICFLGLGYIYSFKIEQKRKITFDNSKRQLIDDNEVYPYDEIENIDVVPYKDYRPNKDFKAIDGTTFKNSVNTFAVKIDLKNQITIAPYIGFESKANKIGKEIKDYINLYIRDKS